jgi:diacylglycerol kinase
MNEQDDFHPVENLPFTIGARIRSFRYAASGLSFVLHNEHNMRIHVAAALCAALLGYACQLTSEEWRWIILAITLVMMTETINTSIEQASNAVTRAHDPTIKAAKDVAAGAVLIAAIASALIGVSVFAPHFFQTSL